MPDFETETFDIDNRFPGEHYVLVRVKNAASSDPDLDVEIEQGGFPNVETAWDFLADLIAASQEA